jgi:hypothetical protein
VAQVLHEHGVDVIVPALVDDERNDTPLWEQQACSIAETFKHVPIERSLIWVAHSGAGPRLPAFRNRAPQLAAGYIFVDAGIPHDVPPEGLSQLDAMERDEAEWARGFRSFLEQGGRFPNWTDEDLRDVIPDSDLRARAVAELKPRGLRYFTEPIPVFAGWPDALCGYIQFSSAYKADMEYARNSSWPVCEIPAGHFHMLVDPQSVASALIETAQSFTR